LARAKTYDVTVIHEPDPDRVMEGLLMLLRWRIEDLRKEGKLCGAEYLASLPDQIERSWKERSGIKAGDIKK